MAQSVTAMSVGFYPAFPPLLVKPAVYFCCTFLRVASTGISPASCPAKLGLSSSMLSHCRDRSDYSLFILAYYTVCVKQGRSICLADVDFYLVSEIFSKLILKNFGHDFLAVVVPDFNKINLIADFEHTVLVML